MKYIPAIILILIACGIPGIPYAQNNSLGLFQDFTHIGNNAQKGLVSYDNQTQEYKLEGASGNMWFDHDDFHFLWKKLKGNFILHARIEFIGKGVEPHRKIGL